MFSQPGGSLRTLANHNHTSENLFWHNPTQHKQMDADKQDYSLLCSVWKHGLPVQNYLTHKSGSDK